ncbi:hypothetical protein [Nonomuraea gerenzanensis]|uniref:hypothetical protein n=1 Tax=Nonomuraea gerenzanensis TaxID=93944 RepID=UPI001CDA059A|nr:hypothetical protein [Nonomuraea gerenzanensis]UBU11401.1 hypothetical protein LCN96_44970 [Nonomuraea gerenzanensis]
MLGSGAGSRAGPPAGSPPAAPATPGPGGAVCATLDRASGRIAPLIAAAGRLSETQARVATNALTFGCFAALEQWYLDGGRRPIADYVEDGMRPLRGIWGPVDPD